jgi:hypothetical protein
MDVVYKASTPERLFHIRRSCLLALSPTTVDQTIGAIHDRALRPIDRRKRSRDERRLPGGSASDRRLVILRGIGRIIEETATASPGGKDQATARGGRVTAHMSC